MRSTGRLEITLKDVRGRPIEDPRVRFSFFRMPQHEPLGRPRTLAVPPNPARFRLPAFPEVRGLCCRLTPSRFRPFDGGAASFSLRSGEILAREFILARDPSKARARFTRWDRLPGSFGPLQSVLRASSPLHIEDGPPREFAGGAYDDVDDEPSMLAKASLLNLYAKMSALDDPVGGGPWFGFVDRILHLRRERFIALVSPGLAESVLAIRRRPENFGGRYRPADSSLHYRNFPEPFRRTFQPGDLFSIKSADTLGNLQLTVAPARDPSGRPVFLLDADIDEHGELLEHFFDLLKHPFTGGSHPFDIHEMLAYSGQPSDFGYELT